MQSGAGVRRLLGGDRAASGTGTYARCVMPNAAKQGSTVTACIK
jgi:hypothetical protein